ncbi:MAG: acyl--CoA ligase, partial [Synergistaceae bacterium]|nr:acyl--CoA ligase [Synergistaceae bacterium]
MFKTIVEAILENGEIYSDKPAVCFKNEIVSWAQLSRFIKNGASVLANDYKLQKGDVILISALSKPEFIAAYFAAQYLGATVIPVDKTMSAEKLENFYKFVEPKIIFTNTKLNENHVNAVSLKDFYAKTITPPQEIVPEYSKPNKEDIAEIIFTTGTTGNPKGAMLSYGAIYNITLFTRDGVERNNECIELLPLPLNHSFGLRVLRTLLYVGGTIILQNGFMFIKETQANLQKFNCNGMSIVPASLEKLQRTLGNDFYEIFKQLKYVEVSAGSLSIQAKQNFIDTMPNTELHNVWGSSESGGVFFLNVTKNLNHIASIGKFPESVKVRFVDKNGDFVPGDSEKTAGRMILQGEMQMSGYFKMPELTKETLKGGWLQTSDLAYKTPDGFVYMLGRVDDIINVGGEKVSPVEIENACMQNKSVRECACIAGNDKTGEFEKIPVLFVASNDSNLTEQDLIHDLSLKLEQWKLPKQIVFIDELPRNAMKKIDKRKLQSVWNNGENLETNPV